MTPLLDFTVLTAPISQDRPAGVPVPPDVLAKMVSARKTSEPHPDDPSKPDIPKKPDWSAIVRLASEGLTKQSKDLRSAVRLVEALGRRDGFAGLRDGLTLLRMLVADCWERMHPEVEGPDDLDARAGPFQWLSDAEGGAWFPGAVRSTPLVKVHGVLATVLDCQAGQVGEQSITIDLLKAAQPATPTTREEVADCAKELTALDQALTTRMADQAPNLSGLVEAVTECQAMLARLETPAAIESTETPTDDGAVETDGAPSATGRATRAATYRQLAKLADDLAKLEPHSPIPDLLRWAVKLGEMPFRQLIQELVREPSVLADIRRQFGIKESEEGSSES